MTQGLLQTVSRRLSTRESIAFANMLPICLRALFVTDWDPDEERRTFEGCETMALEVKALRAGHNFSTETAIRDVAGALRRHVDEESFDEFLSQLPEDAMKFWKP